MDAKEMAISLEKMSHAEIRARIAKPSMGQRIYGLFTKALLIPTALLLTLFFAPILALTALAVRVFGGPGPVLFTQERLGLNGKSFQLLKFRTMRMDAEKDGPQWSSSRDERVTSLGGFLRSSHLDELPQLWNVLRGDMGLIGPRPERPEYYRRLSETIPLFELRLCLKPGITGWAQVKCGYANSVEQSKLKVEADLYYAFHRSLWMDIEILARTSLKFLWFM